MSMYEIQSTIIALNKRREPKEAPMTDDEFEASKDRWRALNLSDVRV